MITWSKHSRRIVATYRDSDTSPKEQFVYHAAGFAGTGNASYIDSVIFRDRDNTNGFDGAADGTLETRRFFAQNWRADISAVLTDTGTLVERVKYSAYGTPFGLPTGDMNADGKITTAGYDDELEASKLVGLPASYDVRADIDLDGDIDTADITAINTSVGTQLGRGKLSRLDTDSRKGYAGYECTGGSIGELWHVRHRALHSGLGRWIQRDSIQYRDGASLFQYTMSMPVRGRDPSGRIWLPCNTPIPWLGGYMYTCLSTEVSGDLATPCMASYSTASCTTTETTKYVVFTPCRLADTLAPCGGRCWAFMDITTTIVCVVTEFCADGSVSSTSTTTTSSTRREPGVFEGAIVESPPRSGRCVCVISSPTGIGEWPIPTRCSSPIRTPPRTPVRTVPPPSELLPIVE